MHVFRHPKYYKELRSIRNKSDQAISDEASTEATSVRPDPGHKPQATSYKLPGPRPISNANKGLLHKRQAPAGGKPQAASLEKQASSPEEQASSLKP